MSDATYSPKEDWPFINYLDTGSLTRGRIDAIQHLVVGDDEIPSRARRKAEPGDMLYSTVRPNQRHFGIMQSVPENFLASTGFAVIRGKADRAHTNFIYWFLAQDAVVEHLHTIAEHSASAYPSIRPADIERLRLSLPPLSEQRAIAQVLGALDDKIELNRRMAATLDEAAKTLFKSWFVDFDPVRAKAGRCNAVLGAALFPSRLTMSEIGEIPDGWRVGTLGGLCEQPQYGYTASAQDRNAVFASYLIRFRPASEGLGRFLQYWLRSDGYWSLVSERSAGTTRTSLNARTLSEFPLVVPPAQVAGAFASEISALRDRVTHEVAEAASLAELRDTLLPKLISGEIHIPDAEKIVGAAT